VRMKQHPVRQAPERVVLASVLRELVALTARVVAVLQTNGVASDDEKEEVLKALETATAVMREVHQRSALLSEDVSLWKLSNVETGVKWQREGQELEYIVELATTMLGKLRNKEHITDREYFTLYRFWVQVVKQHEELYSRWETATKT
jgi:hypothetical protein